MREIKFQAWNTTNAKMIDWDTIKSHLLMPGSSGWIWMQFIGLHDKNGKEIYEGDLLTSDIVYIHEDSDIVTSPCVMEWSKKLACLLLVKGKTAETLSAMLQGWQPSVFTVVGNRYQNPELLEAKK